MGLTGREIHSAFRVRTANGAGTAFLHHTSAGCTFLSAAHVLCGTHAGDNVHLQHDEGWVSIRISQIEFATNNYDVCAFSSEEFEISSLLEPYATPLVALGDRVLFLGFPHDLVNNYPGSGFPTALVRSAHFSGVITHQSRDIVILDGFNNPGYSGGPIYSTQPSGQISLFGIVSGYRIERPSHGKIFRRNVDGTEEEIPDIFTKPNSGMIETVPLAPVTEILSRMTRFLPIAALPPGLDTS